MPYPTGGGNTDIGYPITMDSLSFFVLLGVLALFVAMYVALRANTRSRKALEGFHEAIIVDAVFLLVSVAIVAYLAIDYPHGNHIAYALSQVILGGIWLTFAIPVVTVGFSVHSRTRGEVAWMVPSILFAVGLFVLLYYYTFHTT
jgi:hypothetical protein